MAFTFTNYAAIPPQKSPMADMLSKILSGYNETTKSRYLEPTLQEALQKAKLYNQYYGPNIESQIGLRGAQTGHTNALTRGQNIQNKYLPQSLQAHLQKEKAASENPLLGMTGGAGQIGALLFLQQHPELMATEQQNQGINQSELDNLNPNDVSKLGSQQSYIPSLMQQQSAQSAAPKNPSMPNIQQLLQQSIQASMQPKKKQYAPSNIGKLQEELRDIQEGYYPFTNRSIPIESDQIKEELASPYREKLGGLKQGEHYIYDNETHEKIGQERPYTPKERETEEGRAFFNEVFPTINNSTKDFVGKDSINNFIKHVKQYGKNEQSTRKIDDLLLGQRLMASGLVKESATLGAGKTNQTYNRLEKTFSKSDLPSLIERYGKELILPSEAFVKSGIRFNQILNQATNKASTAVPITKKLYFHPEKYFKTESEQKENLEHHEKTITIRNKKTGKEETVSLEEARKRGIKNV